MWKPTSDSEMSPTQIHLISGEETSSHATQCWAAAKSREDGLGRGTGTPSSNSHSGLSQDFKPAETSKRNC